MNQTEERKSVDLFCDGACSGNPGPGGWGAILRFRDAEKELSGGEAHTTNNRMELMACIAGLEALKAPCLVRVTNPRLRLARRARFGKDPATAVIAFALYRTPFPEGFGTSYLDGFRSFVVDKGEILMETVQGHKVISLFPESPGPNLPIKIMLETHERDRLALYFGRPSLIPPPGSPSRPPSMPPPAGIPSA